MKSRCFRQGRIWPLVLILLVMLPPTAAAQGKQRAVKSASEDKAPSPAQQVAIESLESLARTLKSETDKPSAAALQARIADTLWKFAEPSAREIFSWAFEAARAPLPDDLKDGKRMDYLRRQAVAVKEVLRRLGRHDSKQAEVWFKELEEERVSDEQATRLRREERGELLVQLALELAPTNPEQSARLGLLSLSGPTIPESFGRLLFTLALISKEQGNALFRGALAAMRKNGVIFDEVLISLTNYLFDAKGELHSDADRINLQLFINYLFDAAEASVARWRHARDSGAPSISNDNARLYGLIAVNFLPIVARYDAERLPKLQANMREIAAGLSREQLRQIDALTASRTQRVAISDRDRYGIDEQIERAEKERDPQVRDALLSSVAYNLMRQDVDRAREVAAKIEDGELRAQAEDDINLVRLQWMLNSLSYDEGRKIVLKFSSISLRARMMAELASLALSKDKDAGRAAELLSEAYTIAIKSEDNADKTLALLFITKQFARFDVGRAFEVLGDVVKTVNNLKTNDETRPLVSTRKTRPLRFKTYTVINGSEIAADDRATLDSIDFHQVSVLAAHSYLQTTSLGERIENSLLRTKFMIATASSALSSPPQNLQ